MPRRRPQPWMPTNDIESLETLLTHCRRVERDMIERTNGLHGKLLRSGEKRHVVSQWKRDARTCRNSAIKWRAWGDTLEAVISEMTHDATTLRLLESLESEGR